MLKAILGSFLICIMMEWGETFISDPNEGTLTDFK